MEGTVSIKFVAVSVILTLLCDALGNGVYGCPNVCLCYVDESGLRTANCSGVRFIVESKFNKLFHEIEVLNLRANNDDEPIQLWDDMFTSFSKLKFLNLDKCRINYLPKNVFKGLKKIYEIDLSSNDIRHFENSVFENIYTLHKLNLRGNQLQGSSKPFISSISLRELDLGYCGMTVLQSEFFHGVKRLTRLHLDGNHLQTVKEHVLPRGITHLNLANNRIINVPISTIYSLNQLRWLDLGANPINCTCTLLNLQDLLSRHAVIIDGDLRCAYPQELKDISLFKVNENELCNKETFNSRYHFKKSQTTKYASYQKKGVYFENEKYNPFEIQGDDPGLSTDDYSLEDYPEKDDVVDENKNPSLSKTETNDKITNTEQQTKLETGTNHKSLEAQNLVIAADENSLHNSNSNLEQHSLIENQTSTNIDSASENHSENVKLIETITSTDKAIVVNEDDKVQPETDKKGNEEENGATETNANKEEENNGKEVKIEEPTPAQQTTSDDDYVDIPPVVDDEKHDSVILDENMKNDQVIPVGEIPHNEATESKTDNEDNKLHSDINHDNDTKEGNSDIEKHIIDNIVPIGENNTISENDSEHVSEIDELKSVVTEPQVEGSGGGSDEIEIGNHSIPLFNEDELPEHILPETTQQSVTELPIYKAEIYPVHTDNEPHDNDEKHDTEHTDQVVEKQPINYGEIGPYIVIACIIIFVTILVFIAFYKGVCKSKETNRKPVSDVEASNGTELQDLTSSLLPKSPVNGEKHNNKYPNEILSPETVNLIKADKTDDVNETSEPLNNIHDLNQNDNKNEPIVKNGKHVDGSPPPIEITKAKLTVLLESIPRTPIFVQKRPTTLNNG